jgi:hypothetical protein
MESTHPFGHCVIEYREKVLVNQLGCGHQTWTCLLLLTSKLRNNSACQIRCLVAALMDREGSGVPLIISGSSAAAGGRVVVLDTMMEIALLGLARKVRELQKMATLQLGFSPASGVPPCSLPKLLAKQNGLMSWVCLEPAPPRWWAGFL